MPAGAPTAAPLPALALALLLLLTAARAARCSDAYCPPVPGVLEYGTGDGSATSFRAYAPTNMWWELQDPATCVGDDECPLCLVGGEWPARLASLGTHHVSRHTDEPVSIEIYNWLGHELHSTVARILLEEVMGYDASIIMRVDGDGGFPRVARYPLYMTLEIWDATKRDAYEYYFRSTPPYEAPFVVDAESGNITYGAADGELLGAAHASPDGLETRAEHGEYVAAVREQHVERADMGTVGGEHLYVPRYLAEAHTDHVVEHWRGLMQPETLALFTRDGTLTCEQRSPSGDCAAADWHCHDLDRGCVNGKFVPPQCLGDGETLEGIAANASWASPNCYEVIHNYPEWTLMWFESAIDNLGLNLTVSYLGYQGHRDTLAQRRAAELPYIMYGWVPEPIIGKLDAVQMYLPEFSADCARSHVPMRPFESGVTCELADLNLAKLIGSDVANLEPDLYEFWNAYDITNDDYEGMMLMQTDAGGSNNTVEAACRWVQDNYDVWRSWIANTNENCDAGSTWDSVERQCQPCAPGSAYRNATGACVSCAAGTYQPAGGTFACLTCDPGSFSLGGDTVCALCPRGSYVAESGAAECAFCGIGEYGAAEGLDQCAACPPNAGTASWGTVNASDCACLPGYYSDDRGDCRPCPEGAACAGGDDLPLPAPGYWASAETPTEVLLCAAEEACPGGGYDLCAPGHHGALCSKCADSWYPQEGQCFECVTALPLGAVLVIATAVGVAVCLLMHAFLHRKAMDKARSNVGFTSSVMVSILHLQVLGLFHGLALDWDPAADGALRSLAALNLRAGAMDLGCFASGVTYEQRVASKLLLPLFVALCFCLARPVSRLTRRLAVPDVDELFGMYLLALRLMYIFLVSASLDAFRCFSQTDGSLRMISDAEISCYGSRWFDSVLPMSLTGVMVYGAGVVALFCWLLWMAPQRAHDDRARRRVRMLIGAFRPQTWWWTVVLTARQLAITILISMLAHQPVTQGLVLLSLSVLFLCADIANQPFYSTRTNAIDELGTAVEIGVLLVFLALLGSKGDGHSAEAGSVVVVSLIVALAGGLALVAAHSLRAVFETTKDFGGGPKKMAEELEVIASNSSDDALHRWYHYGSAYDKRKFRELCDSFQVAFADKVEGLTFVGARRFAHPADRVEGVRRSEMGSAHGSHSPGMGNRVAPA